MAGEWRKLSLREAKVTLIDCDHRTPPAAETGYPYVTIPQLRDGRIDITDARRISAQHFAEWTRKAKPLPNDVVLSRRCNPGETAFVPSGLEFALGQNLVLLRADGSEVYPPFLRWLVKGPEWWEQIRKFLNVGAVFDSLRCADVPNFELHIPPFEQQRAISEVLRRLDDKIELNQRMNETLEGLAQALFKSWFVDFDPVRAKAESRDPVIPKPLADLFSDSFVESELGQIPRGWRVGAVGDLGEVICGKTPPTASEENYGEDVPFVTIPDMHGRVFVTRTAKWLSLKGAATQPTKTLPPYAICVSCIATVGLVALTSERCQTNQQINSIVPADPSASLYCYFALRELSNEIRSRGGGGSVVLNLNKGQFSALPVLVPSQSLQGAFQRMARPLFDKILSHERQNQCLALIREALLPKLVSGELRLPDAERIVGRVV
jgi:type I restriction enzyme S subunit